MSTNNFTYKNICVVVHDSNDADDYFYNEDIECWKQKLESEVKGFEMFKNRNWNGDALILGEYMLHRKNGDWYASIQVTYQSGYYVGACLDYDIIYNEDTEDIENKKPKTMEAKLQTKVSKISLVLKTFGVQIVKVGNFSNGEAVYQRVKINKLMTSKGHNGRNNI